MFEAEDIWIGWGKKVIVNKKGTQEVVCGLPELGES